MPVNVNMDTYNPGVINLIPSQLEAQKVEMLKQQQQVEAIQNIIKNFKQNQYLKQAGVLKPANQLDSNQPTPQDYMSAIQALGLNAQMPTQGTPAEQSQKMMDFLNRKNAMAQQMGNQPVAMPQPRGGNQMVLDPNAFKAMGGTLSGGDIMLDSNKSYLNKLLSNPDQQIASVALGNQKLINAGLNDRYQFVSDAKGLPVLKPISSMNQSNITIPSGIKPLSSNATQEQKDAWLSKFDPTIAEDIKGLADYSGNLSEISSKRSNQSSKLFGLAKMYDNTFTTTEFNKRKKFQLDMADNSPGTVGYNILTLNTLGGHLGLLKNKGLQLSNGSITPANFIITTAQQMSGNPNIVNFEEAKSVVDSELERALTGVGATQEGLRVRNKILAKTASPQQIMGAIDTLQDIAGTRLKNLAAQYKSVMGKDAPEGSIVFPENQGMLGKFLKSNTKTSNNLNKDVTNVLQAKGGQQGSQEGLTATNSKGEKLVYRGGKWQPMQ